MLELAMKYETKEKKSVNSRIKSSRQNNLNG